MIFNDILNILKIFKITKTYRNAQALIDCAGKFIMKNPDQIQKDLHSDIQINQPIIFYDFKDSDNKSDRQNNEYNALKNIILSIYRQRSDQSILVLARKNRDLKMMFHYPNSQFVDEKDSEVSIRGVSGLKFNAMTIHSAKGLTADWVIVIGLNEGFPIKNKTEFWLKELFKNKDNRRESIEFSEERRVFYVALTRTRHCVVLLRNSNPHHRSVFLAEIEQIIND